MTVLLISVYYGARFMIVWHLDEKNLCCPPKKSLQNVILWMLLCVWRAMQIILLFSLNK